MGVRFVNGRADGEAETTIERDMFLLDHSALWFLGKERVAIGERRRSMAEVQRHSSGTCPSLRSWSSDLPRAERA